MIYDDDEDGFRRTAQRLWPDESDDQKSEKPDETADRYDPALWILMVLASLIGIRGVAAVRQR